MEVAQLQDLEALLHSWSRLKMEDVFRRDCWKKAQNAGSAQNSVYKLKAKLMDAFSYCYSPSKVVLITQPVIPRVDIRPPEKRVDSIHQLSIVA